MRKFLAAAAITGTVVLAGCDTTSTAANLSAAVAQVIAYTKQACGYVPTATTAANILISFVPGGGAVALAVESAANAICASVTAKSARFGKHGAPMVNGIVVKGHFVRR